METHSIQFKVGVIKKYFDRQVEGYIIGDLRRLIEIQPDEHGNAGCAAPTAMAILAGIELFGTLLQMNPNRLKGSAYARAFIQEYMPEIQSEDIECLRRNFRNNHMHVFFPNYTNEVKYGIIKKSKTNQLLIKYPGVTILNVQRFYELFILAVERLRNHLIEEPRIEKVDPFFSNVYEPGPTGSSTTTTETTFRQ